MATINGIAQPLLVVAAIEHLNGVIESLKVQCEVLSADAARYRWLTADLAAAHGRVKRNQILARIPTMSYSAACMAIDTAMKETYHD